MDQPSLQRQVSVLNATLRPRYSPIHATLPQLFLNCLALTALVDFSNVIPHTNKISCIIGVQRPYTPEEVVALRTSLKIEHSIAKFGAENLWQLLHSEPYVATFGAMTGAQAVQMVKAGVKSVYLSGWQVAADANLSSQTYPDQSLYPSNSVPSLIRRLNNAMMRGDEIDR
jgi:isocitrate lyase